MPSPADFAKDDKDSLHGTCDKIPAEFLKNMTAKQFSFEKVGLSR